MKAFFYLNYFIYRFYENRDPDPFIYSLNGSVLLILLNFITIYYGITYFILKMDFSIVELLYLSRHEVKRITYLNRNYVTTKKSLPEGVQADER